MNDIEKIKGRARRWRDNDYYDKCYLLALAMSGQFDALKPDRAHSESSFRHAMDDLGDYPAICPAIHQLGLQNHTLVNSRINVQGIVHIDPQFTWNTDDPIAKQYLDALVVAWWEEGNWPDQFYQTGMEVETFGNSAVEFGISQGRLTCLHRSVMDTLWDRSYRSPIEWRGLFNRVRLDIDDALETYADAMGGEDEVRRLAVAAPLPESAVAGRAATRAQDEERLVVHEWTYWDPDHTCIFLGGIAKGHTFYRNGSEVVKVEEAGPNPYGIIPYAWWIDSWSPGMARPSGKTETTLRIARMLNEIENYCVQIIRRGIPLVGVNTDKLDPASIELIRNAKGSEDIAKVLFLTGSGDMSQLFQRLDTLELADAVIYFRNVLKEELNAATGVMDMQRGQALGGERKTRFEVATLRDSQGVQARHLRERYGRFLERCVGVARVVALKGETVDRTLYLEDGTLETTDFPPDPYLAAPIYVRADPETMYYKSDEEKRNEAIAEFQAVDMPAIELGVADPYRTFQRLYRRMGRKDPQAAGLYSPAEYIQIQQQKAMQEQMAAREQQQNADNGKAANGKPGRSNGKPAAPNRPEAQAPAGAGNTGAG